jgi:hypothetical protein
MPLTRTRSIPAIVILALIVSRAAHSQAAAKSGDDHRAVIEVGAAAERGTTASTTSAGGTVAVEVTPVENWLELESGVTALHGAGHTELSVDFLFKKPWRLSATSEFMAGLGPELSHRTGTGGDTSVATEIVLDWMFWPRPNVGWYLEPAYSTTAISGGERSIGIAAGLIIGVP